MPGRFILGPSFVKRRATGLALLAPVEEDGVTYDRVMARLTPGFGLAEEDFVVLWVDPETRLLDRVHITLDGFGPTRGAHVDTLYLEFARVGGFVWPIRMRERLRGPFRARAHDWWVTGLDLDRGLTLKDLDGQEVAEAALRPARALPEGSP